MTRPQRCQATPHLGRDHLALPLHVLDHIGHSHYVMQDDHVGHQMVVFDHLALFMVQISALMPSLPKNDHFATPLNCSLLLISAWITQCSSTSPMYARSLIAWQFEFIVLIDNRDNGLFVHCLQTEGRPDFMGAWHRFALPTSTGMAITRLTSAGRACP